MSIAIDFACQPQSASVRLPSVIAQAQRRLKTSSYPAHRNLQCSFCQGVLTLEGCVSSYYLRQMACALVANLAGVERVVDRMQVVEPAWTR